VSSMGPPAALDPGALAATDYSRVRIQPVDATIWLNISAGVWKSRVFLGRSFNCLATAFSLACEWLERSIPLGSTA
jgi:hypothetical protein